VGALRCQHRPSPTKIFATTPSLTWSQGSRPANAVRWLPSRWRWELQAPSSRLRTTAALVGCSSSSVHARTKRGSQLQCPGSMKHRCATRPNGLGRIWRRCVGVGPHRLALGDCPGVRSSRCTLGGCRDRRDDGARQNGFRHASGSRDCSSFGLILTSAH
jgi:hypothetical protein